jgi:fructokinase
MDINLRTPHYNKQTIEELLIRANFLKLNITELNLIVEWYSDFTETKDKIEYLKSRFNIQGVVVTMGAHGALLSYQGEIIRCGGIKVNVIDTIGSGDAFLAGLIAGFMDRKTDKKAVKFANCLGALIASKRGACPEYILEDVDMLMNEIK